MAERRTTTIALLTAALFCLASFYLFDTPTALFFNRFRDTPWWDAWKVATIAGESQWYLIGGLALFALFLKTKRKIAMKGLFLFSTVAASGIAADIMKVLFGRARPKLLLNEGIYGFGFLRFGHEWASFPSGHSATAFSVAVTLSLLFPRFRILFLSAAAVVAASRVVLVQHYISDIVAGSILGAATVVLFHQRYFRTALHDARN